MVGNSGRVKEQRDHWRPLTRDAHRTSTTHFVTPPVPEGAAAGLAGLQSLTVRFVIGSHPLVSY